MIKNSLMKFIDSCVGNIARKIEDEFRESDHPRDKGGKFTSKGGEGRGEGGLHHAGKDVEEFGKELGKRREGVIEKQKSRRGKSEIEGGEGDLKHEVAVEETDDIMQRMSDTGIDVEEFMSDLGINTSRIPEDRLEETLSEELYADPNLRDKALKELKSYAGEDDDDDEAGKKKKSSSRKAPRGRGGVQQAKAKSARINRLIDIAEEGFTQNPDMLDQWLEDNSIPKETDYDGEEVDWSEMDEDVKLGKVRDFIIEDPDRAQEALGEWADTDEEDDDDNTSVTGPEDRDHMNEEDDDDSGYDDNFLEDVGDKDAVEAVKASGYHPDPYLMEQVLNLDEDTAIEFMESTGSAYLPEGVDDWYGSDYYRHMVPAMARFIEEDSDRAQEVLQDIGAM